MEESVFCLFDELLAEEMRRNIYQPISKGTALYQAIRACDQPTVDAILEIYKEDFETVKKYLESKYLWNTEDKIWLRKTILVATSEDQCQSAKQLERNSISIEDWKQAVFILLKNPVDGESVAVIQPNNSNCLEAFRIIREMIPNGFLTLNNTGLDGKQETFIETAALVGRNDMITHLLELGAELAPPNHNPLIAACFQLQKDTISWLLDEHFDNFDCSMRDTYQRNAFLVPMQRKNLELMDFVLKKMIAYRQKYYGETESEAFNSIFRYEDEDLSSLSCLTYASSPELRDRVSEYVAQYKLDLTYQWEGVIFLSELLQRKMALEYCYSELKKNPKLLKIIVHGNISVLHYCIRLGLFDVLREMYESKPEVKRIFETDQGFSELQAELYDGNHAAVRFILDNHKDFLMENLDKLRAEVIFCSWYDASFFEKNADILSEYFPELKQDLEEAKNKVPASQVAKHVENAFSKLRINSSETAIKLTDSQQSLSSIRGINGETLLHFAVDQNDRESFLKLLEAGCDFDALDNEGNHPVHYVRCAKMFDFIIENHPEGHSLVHRQNSAGLTVLHKICSRLGDQKTILDLIERIIECGADVNQLTNNGESVVHKTASIDVLNLLLKHNVDLEVVNEEGNSALLHHLSLKNTWIAGTLFPLVHKLPSFKEYAHKCLAPLMYKNRGMFICDYQEFLRDNPETTKLIFDSVYNHSREEASRLFNKACNSAHNFIAGKFLEFDFDLDFNLKDEYNYTAIVGLLSHMEEDNVLLVKQLLRKDVDLEIRSQWGRNALLCLVDCFRSAKWYGHSEETVQLLLDHGARINATDDDGNTALHLAFAKNEYKLVELLVRNGADLTVKNKAGKVPVMMGGSLNEEIFGFMT